MPRARDRLAVAPLYRAWHAMCQVWRRPGGATLLQPEAPHGAVAVLRAIAGPIGQPWHAAGAPCEAPAAHIYARRSFRLNLRSSNCWFGFGVNSTYFWIP